MNLASYTAGHTTGIQPHLKGTFFAGDKLQPIHFGHCVIARIVVLRTVFNNFSYCQEVEVDFSNALTYPSACLKTT